MRKTLYLVLVSFFLVSTSLFAQERNCATMEYLEIQKQNDPGLEQRMAEIEAYTQNYIQNAPNLSVNAEIFYVPVVVHVVWNSANPAENITDAQILSQIDVIYKDFRRLNDDADDTWPQAADMEIEFYLAQEDPDGNATTGITRKETDVASWGTSDNIKYSSSGGVDAWDPIRYFNFWVGNIGGGILGYATFPASAGDPNDGIVMSPEYFGSSDYEAAAGETFYLSAPYDKGRTTTHEMGHYFNLRHIWGDGGCGVDDFVEDTPESGGSNFGCPSGIESCGSVDMVQNYMDYTDDACMNLFTQGQADRMRATLGPGGPREVLNQPLDYSMALASPELEVCAPADAVFDFTYNTFNDFTDTTTFAAVGLPMGASPVFSPVDASADGTAVTLTISGLGSVAVGNYPFTIEGTSGTTVRQSAATLGVYDTNFAVPSLSAPANGATEVVPETVFTWVADPNALEYDIEIASDAGFATIVESATVDTNTYTASSLMTVTQYFWRILHKNDCATGSFSAGQDFTTSNLVCDPYNSTDTPVGIPDNSGAGIDSVINIGTTSEITDVNVTINITHTWDSDLTLTLTSPGGTSVILSDGNGSSGDNYTDTVFDQEATDPITSGAAPFTGTFQPEGDLSLLNGEFSGGDWTLNVSDGAGGDTGTINSWSLEICGVPQPDDDGDGVPNGLDNCPDMANVDQADLDTDGIGDVCDDDMDGDGVLNVDDNCPETANADQADADGDGLGDLCDGECQMFTASDTPIVITTSGGVTYTSVINILDDLSLEDVNVKINIDHSWDSDLDIYLQSPVGTVVELTTDNGGSGDNYTDTVFDDAAVTSILSGSAPFTDTYQPEGSLADFNGEMTLGDWTLIVTDDTGGDGGTINLFEIELCVIGEFSPDTDGDGVIDSADNCVDVANADQADLDSDGIGDVCDDDMDGDGVLNVDDNCPETANADQADGDGDGLGDVCDFECGSFSSNDTPISISTTGGVTYTSVLNYEGDYSIADINVRIDIDHTYDSDLDISIQSPNGTIVILSEGNGGFGDNYTDTVFDDDAADSISSGSPPFTGEFQPQGSLADIYGESTLGDWTLIVTDTFAGDGGSINLFEIEFCVAYSDIDGDGITDFVDNCPETANADQADLDNDGIGDVCDDDVDGDGVANTTDNCPEIANSDQADLDNDGIGDICDDDVDGDGVNNTTDNCEFMVNSDQADLDMDGIGDVCDPDVDGDGVPNDYDNCPETPNEDQSDVDGNGKGDACDGLIVNDVLTPNGDGMNDTWEIANIERFPNTTIRVFSRWGNEVFSTNNYNNDWGGTSDSGGDVLPTGSYFYQIDQGGDGQIVLQGWLYLTN